MNDTTTTIPYIEPYNEAVVKLEQLRAVADLLSVAIEGGDEFLDHTLHVTALGMIDKINVVRALLDEMVKRADGDSSHADSETADEEEANPEPMRYAAPFEELAHALVSCRAFLN